MKEKSVAKTHFHRNSIKNRYARSWNFGVEEEYFSWRLKKNIWHLFFCYLCSQYNSKISSA
jgi:hypothetical protein